MTGSLRLLTSDGSLYSDASLAAPLVSVIVNNYNYGRFLRDAVNSVFAQAYPNIECIIVDDASTDESAAVLATIEAAHPAVKIIRRLENGGQLAACLDGLHASVGDYILFLDADDLLLEECIATHAFVNLSLRFPVGFTCSDMVVVAEDRLLRGSQLPITCHINAPATTKSEVRPIPEAIAGEWISKVDVSIIDRLYNVDTNCREWPWSQTSGMFFRRDALSIWASMPGLAHFRQSTDSVFARGINAITGSVVIDQSLGVQRLHSANSFCERPELANLLDFDVAKEKERRVRHRAALLNEVMRDPQRFNLIDRAQLRTILEAFDTPNDSFDAPYWATSSRLSHLLALNYRRIAEVLGEQPVIAWMRERQIPDHVIEQACGAKAASLSAVKLPLLSFIVVNHNYGRFLSTCVESIVSQNYGNIECIIVDNASTDESAVVLQELSTRYPSLRVIRNEENVGQPVACAIGFALTRADYVAFVDADDYLLPNFAGTHIRAHLSLPIPVGFTSCDMAELVSEKVVVGRLSQFGKNSCAPINPEALRDIKDVSAIVGSDELEAPEFCAALRLVQKTNTDWVWAPTTGTVYRSDAVRMFAFNPQLKSLRLAADCYFDFPINALSGSVLIEKSLAVYRIHGENSFTKRAALEGTITYKREMDEGAKAAFVALQYIVAEFDSFYARSPSPRDLWTAMQTLRRKSATHQRKWAERIVSYLMRAYFVQILTYLRRKFRSARG